MRVDNFIKAVDEIRNNGGSRQTVYLKEVWKDRCMTIFGYSDGTAEVFEDTCPFMYFYSLSEALFALNRIQAEYDRQVVEDRKRMMDNRTANIHTDIYASPVDWYARAPRGTYFGD